MAATTTIQPAADSWLPTYARDSQLERTVMALRAPIVVATDGTEASEPGIVTARTLAHALKAPVQLISVIEPLHALMPSGEGAAAPSVEDRQRAEERLQLVREQQSRAGGEDGWTIEIKYGDPATTLVRVAKARNARVLVVGRRTHGRMDQLLGDDTAFDVVRLSEVPVLIAAEPMTESPRVVTVGVDFSELSTFAARAAIELCGDAGLVYLLHVRPRTDVLAGLAAQYGSSVDEGFATLTKELGELPGIRIDTIELTGVPARELVDFAESSRSQLLVVGSYKRGLFRRLVGGAMASRVLRAAPCPVLIVPEMATEDTLAEQARPIHDQVILTTVHELTTRNSGRRIMFEVDNPRAGAQLLAFDYTFLAAEFDVLTEKIHIALTDDPERSCQSVTQSFARPLGIDVQRGLDGRDHVIRLLNGCGQAVMTFW